MMDRRRFIAGTLGTALLAGLGPVAAAGERRLRLLVLGGTGFLGPHTVRAALARGHEVTLFNRGRTNPHLFPDLEKLTGDRDGGLGALEGRRWDAVIDTSGYVPRIVRQSAELLADSVERYLFVSTISVYASLEEPGMDETAPVGRLDNPDTETVDGETYGPLKALCEQVVGAIYGRRATVLRPGLIVGPGDPTDRFTYWPARVAEGGDVLAPGDGRDPVQVIDARDLGAWMVHCLETGAAGTFNAVGPRGAWDMAGLLAACREAAGSDARFLWADAAFLAEHGVAAWTDMPVWVPRDGDFAGASNVSVARAEAAGLVCRPLGETVSATLDWYRDGRDPTRPMRAGISREREAELLAQLRART